MKQLPKSPQVPELTTEQIAYLTEICFGVQVEPRPCDALFVFSGTHPGHWEKAIEAYQKGYAQKMIVTCGRSLTGQVHEDWHHEGQTEAEVIINHLLTAGVPRENIVAEHVSTNTLENVTCAKEVFDFSTINSLMFVCKSHATGRQWRTLAKHLPGHLTYVPFSFATTYQGQEINRDNRMRTEIGRSRVWGEYLRIQHYGDKGDILALGEGPIS